MIAIEPFEAEFPISDATGGRTWQRCKVVGISVNEGDYQPKFVVLVIGPTLYVDTVAEVRSQTNAGKIPK